MRTPQSSHGQKQGGEHDGSHSLPVDPVGASSAQPADRTRDLGRVSWRELPYGPSVRHGEALTLGRAALSSLLATLNDGLVYQGLLTIARGHYGRAAFAGAAMGAVMNFSLNRLWVFRGPWKSLSLQASQYAMGAVLTFLGLQVILWVLIEVFGLGARSAWIPAKTLAFAMVSYPVQRFLVFDGKPGDHPRWQR